MDTSSSQSCAEIMCLTWVMFKNLNFTMKLNPVNTWPKNIKRNNPISDTYFSVSPLRFQRTTTRVAALAFGRALRDPKGEHHGCLSTYRGINIPKSGAFKNENIAQTLPKQLQNNFEKGQKMTFLT